MFPQLGPMEMVVIMGVAVLLFGKRLPEVGRSLGKGIVEFKKGLRGIEDEFDLTSTSSSSSGVPARRAESKAGGDYAEAAVPKFEPPPTPPVPHMDYEPQPAQD
jgi:sec-independent protein translocase protein TatA